jgi:hypothetical protein
MESIDPQAQPGFARRSLTAARNVADVKEGAHGGTPWVPPC